MTVMLFEASEISPIDGRVLMFGNSFVAITHTGQFMARFVAAVEAQRLPFGCRLVEYCNETAHSGQTGIFSKPLYFVYQNEFRFAIEAQAKAPFKLKLGNLEDITTRIMPSSSVYQLDLTAEKARLAGFTWPGM
nr:hypothetical protein [uncultured Rhodopila sp.]